MLGSIYKFEISRVIKNILYICLAMILSSVLFSLTLHNTELSWLARTFMQAFGAVILFSVLYFVTIMHRLFFTSLFGDEAYITHQIPCSTSDQVFSRYLVIMTITGLLLISFIISTLLSVTIFDASNILSDVYRVLFDSPYDTILFIANFFVCIFLFVTAYYFSAVILRLFSSSKADSLGLIIIIFFGVLALIYYIDIMVIIEFSGYIPLSVLLTLLIFHIACIVGMLWYVFYVVDRKIDI